MVQEQAKGKGQNEIRPQSNTPLLIRLPLFFGKLFAVPKKAEEHYFIFLLFLKH
jgi:hypothetical protein